MSGSKKSVILPYDAHMRDKNIFWNDTFPINNKDMMVTGSL